MYVYDTHNRPMDDVNFTKPLHVNVNSDDGILDIVCESITELEGTNKGILLARSNLRERFQAYITPMPIP